MNNASFITTVTSTLTIPDQTLHHLSAIACWNGNNFKAGFQEPNDIFSRDHDSIQFSTVECKRPGKVEITFLNSDGDASGCLVIPFTSSYLFTIIKDQGNEVMIASATTLS